MIARLANPWILAAGRAVNTVFFLTTAVYAVLASSPFAYEQFIQPNMLAWLSSFVFLWADFYWLALCVTVLTLAPRLGGGRARAAAWAYIAVAGAIGAFALLAPVLPAGGQPRRAVAVALASAMAIVWLAAIDHLTADPRDPPRGRHPAGLFVVCIATALVVWAIYAAAAPVRLRAAGGLIDLSRGLGPLLVGAAAAGVSHLTVFTMVFLVWSAAGRASLAAATAALGFVLQRVVFVPIAVVGPASWAVSLALAVAIVSSIRGIARHLIGRRSEGDAAGSRIPPAVVLALLPAAAWATLFVLTTFDWGFMLQKLSAVAVAAAAFAAVRTIVDRSTPLPARTDVVAVAGPIVVLAAYAASVFAMPRIPQSEFLLDAYSAGDPSYRFARQFLAPEREMPSDAAFFAYLRANTSIAGAVEPVSVDFVPHLTKAPGRPPNIFLFIIDSLRRDYVAPYNSVVRFTPRLAAFARDSVVFDRAFSRYGGTGLAVPAIWAGALVVHKQYVTPFAPMNALGKLLDANGYRRVVTRDHITEELFGLPAGSTELDRHVPEMMHTFCGTMAQLTDDLRAHRGDSRPIFAHTRPLDLHIGNTRLAPVPPGESYPGFFEPYAARVMRIDACFGEFVDAIKRDGLYDDSIIVVMSDHGDSLGEGLRWGHGYTVVPEVLRIPLMIRVPETLRDRFAVDPARVSFATDVTPTLYALLGYTPQRPRALAGVPLFAPAGSKIPSRRAEAYLVASSYGAVYGLIRHNGRRLYIADAIEGRDSMYDLSPAAGDVRIGMTDADRLANRALIREQIADLAAWYGLQQP